MLIFSTSALTGVSVTSTEFWGRVTIFTSVFNTTWAMAPPEKALLRTVKGLVDSGRPFTPAASAAFNFTDNLGATALPTLLLEITTTFASLFFATWAIASV